MGRAGTRALSPAPPMVRGSHTAVADCWVTAIEVTGFACTRASKQMTHGSTKIRPIGATGFAATDFFGVAHISNRFFRKVGTTGSRGQALQFSTAGEKPRNQHKGGESNDATGDTNSFRPSQFFWRWLFRHVSPSLKARRFKKMLSDGK